MRPHFTSTLHCYTYFHTQHVTAPTVTSGYHKNTLESRPPQTFAIDRSSQANYHCASQRALTLLSATCGRLQTAHSWHSSIRLQPHGTALHSLRHLRSRCADALCTNMACDHGPARRGPFGTIDDLQVHHSRPDILSYTDGLAACHVAARSTRHIS